jgi:hypothetical protein
MDSMIHKFGELVEFSEFAEITDADKERINNGIYAYQGEEVFCERGHLIGTIRRDMKLGDIMQWDAIVGLDGLKTGDHFPPCKCGAYFTSGDNEGQGYLRFKTGFRRI